MFWFGMFVEMIKYWKKNIFFVVNACIGVGKPDKVLDDKSERNIN